MGSELEGLEISRVDQERENVSRVNGVEVIEIEAAETGAHFLSDVVEEEMAVVHPAEEEDVLAVDDRSGFRADLPADAHEAGDRV